MVAWFCPLISTTTALLALRRPSVATRASTLLHHPSSSLSASSSLAMSSSSATTDGDGGFIFTKPVVQYIFVRRDLTDWPAGAVAAQVAHASVAAIVEAKNDAATAYYTSPSQLPSMTKYVYGVDSLGELETVKQKWTAKFGETCHYYWMEQPENIPTAMATWPVERTNPVSKLVKNLKVTFL